MILTAETSYTEYDGQIALCDPNIGGLSQNIYLAICEICVSV